MTKDTFQLEGVTYFAVGRTCGKSSCRCQSGELHGPYWYARDRAHVRYLGKTLPAAVTTARAAYQDMHEAVDATFRQRLQEAAALGTLLQGGRLMDAERAMIRALGFGACLVPAELANPAKDDDEALPVVLDAPDGAARATPAIDDDAAGADL